MDNACCVLFGVRECGRKTMIHLKIVEFHCLVSMKYVNEMIKGSVWNEGIWEKRNSSSKKQLSSTMKLVHKMIKGLFGSKEFGRKK